MNQQQLLPKPRRVMKQPRKAVLRDQLAEAHEVIERQAQLIQRYQSPWWRRLFRRSA